MKGSQQPIKSWVRVKAFVLLGILVLGILQAFSFVPWDVAKPVQGGLALFGFAAYFSVSLQCENCGISVSSAVMAIQRFYGEAREAKREELVGKGNSLSAYKKHCVHCGQERI